MQELSGRVAVVTGAASGIGAGIARACAEQQMRVVLADIEVEPAEKLAEALRAAGCESLALRCDVSSSESVEALAAAAFERFGAVHLLCNNAGVAQGGALHEHSDDDWQWLLGVNLYGVIHGCQAFVPRFLEQVSGGEPAHIVNTASVGGFLSGPVLGMYSVSKFAVVAYSEALQLELAPQGVGVSVLCPGWTDTDLGRASRNRPADFGRAPDKLEIITPGMAEGMDPFEVGRRTLRGVREGALYVFTHPEFRAPIAERFEKVLAALERGEEPVD